MAIQPETIAGRKEYFRRKREEFVATWQIGTDSNNNHRNIRIPLTGGLEAIISADKKELAAQFMWRLKRHSARKGRPRGVPKFYVEAPVTKELRGRYGKTTSLHRVVSGAPEGVEVDHLDGNGLNCVDENLRLATRSQNACNRHYRNKTGYRGVVCAPYGFNAQITFQGKNRHIGFFLNPLDAAKAYNNEALRLFGEFAVLNKIEEGAWR